MEHLREHRAKNIQEAWDAVFDEARQRSNATGISDEYMLAVRDVFESEWNKADNWSREVANEQKT
jgi:hypothetical protein